MLTGSTSSITLILALSGTAAGALGALGALGGLSYAPEKGAEDTQMWSVSHSLELQSITAELSSDEPVNVPEIEMEGSYTRQLTLDQVHESAAEGAPRSLRRSFVEVEEAIEGRFIIASDDLDETLDAAVEGRLEDAAVRMRWVDDDEDWARAFVDEDGAETEGPRNLLDGLAVDADLGGLLRNAKEDVPGTRWTAEATCLTALVCPGGNLGSEVSVESAGERGMEPVMGGLDPLLGLDLHLLLAGEAEGSLEGEIECELVSVDGNLAKLSINVDVIATRDVQERLEGWLEGFDGSMAVTVKSGIAELMATGEGTVVWDLEAGLPRGVELKLDLTYQLRREADLDIPGEGEVVLTTVIDLAGSLTSTMESE